MEAQQLRRTAARSITAASTATAVSTCRGAGALAFTLRNVQPLAPN